jgi:hypothetical protein
MMNKRQQIPQNGGNLRRAIRWLGALSGVPGIILPFYQYFIHGGRDAASIMQHPAEHATAHVVAALCFFLLLLGLVAIYLVNAERIGKYGLVNFILIFLSLALYGANLYMDAFTNTVLAKYEPVLQTQWHSASLGMDTPLTELLGPALFATPIAMIILLLSGVSFGIVLIRAKILPWYVGALFIIGATVLSTGAMLPYRVVAIGYGGTGLAIALPGFLIFSGKVKRKSEASSRHAVTTTTQAPG